MNKKLPFHSRFTYAIVQGRKTCTARTKKYGEVGDVLETAAGAIQLTEVEKVRLDTVRDHYWRDEGVGSPEEFEQVWTALHPRKGFVPDQNVWLHRFRRVNHDRPAVNAAIQETDA